MLLKEILKIVLRTIKSHSGCTLTGHNTLWSFKGTNSPTRKIASWQTYVDGTLAFDIRRITNTRTAGTGAAKWEIHGVTDKWLPVLFSTSPTRKNKLHILRPLPPPAGPFSFLSVGHKTLWSILARLMCTPHYEPRSVSTGSIRAATQTNLSKQSSSSFKFLF